MEYVPADASELPKSALPDLTAWVSTICRFAHHMRRMVSDGIASGALDEDDAEEFETVLTVAPTAEPSGIDAISSALPYSLPSVLRDFFITASSEISFRYAYDLGDDAPDGVPSWVRGGEMASIPDPIFSAQKLEAYVADARNYAATSGISDFPEDQEAWNRSIPFFRFNNSNFLALDPVLDAADPFVILLDHEGDPRLIARNLAGFLVEWPRICYVGPGDYYDIESFIDPDTGVLSGDTPAATALRDALKWTP
ncbi:MAG: hypothetical protein AAF802_30270 [Planctomycetota bacterium]